MAGRRFARRNAASVLFLLILTAALPAPLAGADLAGTALAAEGERLFMENKPIEAISVLEQALRASPDEKLWLYLGMAYQQTGKLDDAIGAYRKGLAMAVRFRHRFLFNIANCYYAQGKNAFAEELYGQAIEARGDYANAYLNRANVRMRLGSTKDAASDYTIYLSMDPGSPQAPEIRRLLALLGEEINAADSAKAAEEARRLAEEAARKALLDSLADSLKDNAGDTTNLSGGTDDPQDYGDNLPLAD